ncbi:unnamed protein product [Calypogeia fissa]
MPSLQFLPEEVRVGTFDPDVEGPLLFWCTHTHTYADELIRIHASLKTYKVFVFSRHPPTWEFDGFELQSDINDAVFVFSRQTPFQVGLYVLKVDLETQRLRQVARGPSEAFSMVSVKLLQPVSDGDNIFFGVAAQGQDEDHIMVEYNVKRNRWRFSKFYGPEYSVRLPQWSPVTFQPLNPFLEV